MPVKKAEEDRPAPLGAAPPAPHPGDAPKQMVCTDSTREKVVPCDSEAAAFSFDPEDPTAPECVRGKKA